MATASPSIELDITKLRQFHAAHFTSQPIPNISSASAQRDREQDHEVELEAEEYEDGLGYYEDGVKRTLTDQQIEMFRHSEVQRLLAARRWDTEVGDDEGSSLGDSEKKNDEQAAKVKRDERSSMDNGKPSGAPAKGKRKAHFDEPQGENAEVVLDY